MQQSAGCAKWGQKRPTCTTSGFIGDRDYLVLEGEQRIGRIRYAAERTPGIWVWIVAVHLAGGRLPAGTANSRFVAMAEFKAAWELLKTRTTPEDLAAAFKAMNIRGEG